MPFALRNPFPRSGPCRRPIPIAARQNPSAQGLGCARAKFCHAGGARPVERRRDALRGRAELDAGPELGGGDRLITTRRRGRPQRARRRFGPLAPAVADCPFRLRRVHNRRPTPINQRSHRPFVVTVVVAALVACRDATAGGTQNPAVAGLPSAPRETRTPTAYTGRRPSTLRLACQIRPPASSASTSSALADCPDASDRTFVVTDVVTASAPRVGDRLNRGPPEG